MGTILNLHQVRHLRSGREILRIDDLTVEAGERVSILGPNGAGKTTLLRLLAAVESPSAGTVTLDNHSTARGGVQLRRRIAYATQQPGLLSTSVRRNVELPLRWRKMPRRQRTHTAMTALHRLRIAHLADRTAQALSGGEQQRVNLARALALNPSVLLLDEPAASLDTQTRAAFFTDIEQALAERTTTVVQVSHRAEEALRFANRVVILLDGRVHQVATPETLHQQPADTSVARLVGYENLIPATVSPDGAVLVDGAPTGLRHHDERNTPATVAVFAAGIHLTETPGYGLPIRVARVTPGPGYHVLALEGVVSLLAHLPMGEPPPEPGDTVRVVFDPKRSVVLPHAPEHSLASFGDASPATIPP